MMDIVWLFLAGLIGFAIGGLIVFWVFEQDKRRQVQHLRKTFRRRFIAK
jgi:uncharacterized membrane protein YccC